MPSSKTIHSQQRLRYQRFLFISILRQNPRALTPHHGVIPKALRPELGRGAAQCSSVPAKSRTPGSASKLICRAAWPAQPIGRSWPDSSGRLASATHRHGGTRFKPLGRRNLYHRSRGHFLSRLAGAISRLPLGSFFGAAWPPKALGNAPGHFFSRLAFGTYGPSSG